MKTKEKNNKSGLIIKVYPFAVLLLSVLLNFTFGMDSVSLSIPTKEVFGLLSIAAAILLINHSWIMTSTELTRFRYKIFASPEEWKASGKSKAEITEDGHFEIERHLNTHRNTTENTIYYIFIVILFSMATPNQVAAWSWILMFPLARLGYTYSYLKGKDNLRGIFMTLTLMSIYGMAFYLTCSWFLK
jgi:uncharacterized MAPEG superfamily protein